MPAPLPLISVDPIILSSYGKDGKTGGPRSNLQPLVNTKMGIGAPEAVKALLVLHHAVTEAGGDFRVTELHRDVAVQQAARKRYENWCESGKPKPGTKEFDSKTMKADFVALPGKSMHNGGRAIDFHVDMLQFPHVAKDKQLDKMWEICIPLGWTPIIKEAKEGASESWHLDYWGEFAGVRARLGYEQAAMAGALVVGHAGSTQTYEYIVQALLQRAGFSIGSIDGMVGPNTLNALALALGTTPAEAKKFVDTDDTSVYAKLLALPAK